MMRFGPEGVLITAFVVMTGLSVWNNFDPSARAEQARAVEEVTAKHRPRLSVYGPGTHRRVSPANADGRRSQDAVRPRITVL